MAVPWDQARKALLPRLNKIFDDIYDGRWKALCEDRWEATLSEDGEDIIAVSRWDGVSGNLTVKAMDELAAWMALRKLLDKL